MLLICRQDNDLFRVLEENGVPCARYDGAVRAVGEAPAGAGVLWLADGYPDAPTTIEPTLLEAARAKGLRLYVEFPATLPGLAPGESRGIEWKRAVVASGAFAPTLEAMRILMIHGCRFLPVQVDGAHIVIARVAGFDTAVYGLPEEQYPVLFEHDGLLVATTKLSQFITARYAPADAWQAIWRWILRWCSGEDVKLNWTPAVRPSFGAEEPLPAQVEAEAVRRGAGWFDRAKLFVHPSREAEVIRLERDLNDGTGPGPDADWAMGDGTHGMLEGASATIRADGSQYWRYFRRNDCMGEAAMARALDGTARGLAVAGNLCDYIYFLSTLAQGPRANPASPSYGLVAWFVSEDVDTGIYYGDDNARSLLGTLAAAAVLGDDRWDALMLRCLLANLRTTGPQGFRGNRMDEPDVQQNGWRYYWETARTNFAPHYESWLWAAFLWAYRATGFAPFLQRAKTAIELTMAAYPDAWHWTNGIQQERARMLLPLAWLVRVEDTAEHREWLRFMAQELLAHQVPCGAIREEIGSAGKGSYAPPASNETYGTNEAPLIQANGDPLCDLLYTTNFAIAGLHEAAAATGEALFTEAEDRLAAFLCRIQATSEAHPELDGAWFRAFDFRRWDYWASNADLGWGAWSIESGWTQAWIVSILALRQMRTSYWELTAGSGIGRHLEEMVQITLPEE